MPIRRSEARGTVYDVIVDRILSCLIITLGEVYMMS